MSERTLYQSTVLIVPDFNNIAAFVKKLRLFASGGTAYIGGRGVVTSPLQLKPRVIHTSTRQAARQAHKQKIYPRLESQDGGKGPAHTRHMVLLSREVILTMRSREGGGGGQ